MSKKLTITTKVKPVKIEGMYVLPSMANIFSPMVTAETIRITNDKAKRLRGVVIATSVSGVPCSTSF